LLRKLLNLNKITVMVLFVFLTGCRNDDPKNVAGQDIIRLSYWCASNPRETELAKELVAAWNRQNDLVKVDVQPIPSSQSSEEVLLAAIAAKTTPDICSNMWPGAMDDFIASGGLVRLDQFSDFEEYIMARVPENLLSSFQANDGHYYQLPWKTNPTMIVYNKGLFKKAGVNAPLKTYSEFLAAAEKLTIDKDGDGKIDQWMNYRDIKPIWWQRLFDFYPFYIGASGGGTLFKKNIINFNNSHSVEVFDFFRTLYEKKYMPVTDFQGNQFLTQALATQITGPYFIGFLKQYKDENLDFGVMPIPVPDDYKGPVYSLGDFKNISVFSTTKYPEQAWKFAKYLISAKADLRLLQVTGQIPVRKNLISDSLYAPYFEKEPEMVAFAEQSAYTRGVDGVSDLREILDIISQEYESSVIYQITPVDQAVKRASERVKVIMDWNRN
jgi:multiple sugar transport system substrate-binding protein